MWVQEVLTAERELGRLTEALSQPEARSIWRADALRREVLASAQMDGPAVTWHDLVVAQLNPGFLQGAHWQSLAAPLMLSRIAHRLARSAHPPLSQGWLEDGLRPDIDGAELVSVCRRLAAALQGSAGVPGLPGVARAYVNLQPPSDRTPADGIVSQASLGRLLAPWLVQQFCSLPYPLPWLAKALPNHAIDEAALLAMAGPIFFAERERLTALRAIIESWENRVAQQAQRRWATTQQALRLLLDHPAVTSLFLAETRPMSRRAAQDLIRQWEEAGVVRRERLGRASEWVIADDLCPVTETG